LFTADVVDNRQWEEQVKKAAVIHHHRDGRPLGCQNN
jgi:hypothetical protein